MEADVTNRHVTIVEVRPLWDGQPELTRFPIARLRYTKTTGLWSLYWRDRNERFHLHRYPPTPSVGALLSYLDSHDDPIFFG